MQTAAFQLVCFRVSRELPRELNSLYPITLYYGRDAAEKRLEKGAGIII